MTPHPADRPHTPDVLGVPAPEPPAWTARWRRAPGDPVRWGVYLRPDPRTCAAVTAVTASLRAQYGLVSAGAFPPHSTLVGSRHAPVREEVLVAALDEALTGRAAVEVTNSGVVPLDQGFVFDLQRRADGSRNEELVELAAAVDAAVTPCETPAPNPHPQPFDRERFSAHLSLASHDLLVDPHLRPLVAEFLEGLGGLGFPAGFLGDTVELYATRSDDWSGRWWHTLRWTHIHTWRLPRADEES